MCLWLLPAGSHFFAPLGTCLVWERFCFASSLPAVSPAIQRVTFAPTRRLLVLPSSSAHICLLPAAWLVRAHHCPCNGSLRHARSSGLGCCAPGGSITLFTASFWARCSSGRTPACQPMNRRPSGAKPLWGEDHLSRRKYLTPNKNGLAQHLQADEGRLQRQPVGFVVDDIVHCDSVRESSPTSCSIAPMR